MKTNRLGGLGFIFFTAKRPKPVKGLLISVTEPADDALWVMLAGSGGFPTMGTNHPSPDHLAAMQQQHWEQIGVPGHVHPSGRLS